MTTLEALAVNHSQWVQIAKGICKDPYLADDLVSEMYLKLSGQEKSFNSSYIRMTLNSLFIDYLREEKKFLNIDTHKLTAPEEDNEAPIPVELPECLSWVEKTILLLRQEKSGREIEKQYHINFQKVHRIERKAKAKLREWAKQSGA